MNIVADSVITVDANDKPLTTIYAETTPVYLRVTFTTYYLPSAATYRIRYIVGGQTIFSPYIHDGAEVLIPFVATYSEFDGPFTAVGGPPTGKLANQASAYVNPDPDTSFVESSYTDNYITNTFAGISTPAQLGFTSQNDLPPTFVTAGVPFSGLSPDGLQASVEDMFGNVVADSTDVVTVAVASGPAGSAVGGGNTMVSAVDGVATFRGLTLNKATTPGDLVTLVFSDLELTTVTTTGISVLPGKATQLQITTPPNSNAIAGNNFGLQVADEDQFGNVETGDNLTKISASLASGAGSLITPETVSVQSGVATFYTLADDTAGPITVALNSGLLTQAVSGTVTILPSFASELVIVAGPPATGTVGQPLASAPVVKEEDRFGNVETGDNSTAVTAKLASGAGTLQGASAVVSAGVATFANLADSKAEKMTLKFSIQSLTTGVTSAVVIGKATPTINWKQPGPIGVGSGLSAAQLDATAGNYGTPVPGTFTYTPAAGSVLTTLGPHQLSVTFTPTDTSDYTAATGTATVQVLLASTTSLTASAATVTYKQPITFTAGVAPATPGVAPVGSVTFLDGSTVLGSSKLDGTGHATFSTANLPSGVPTIKAVYSGDSNYGPSASTAATLHVHQAPGADFNGDGRTDIVVFDQSTATFYIQYSGGGSEVQKLGNATHVNVPVYGDFDGDGKTDIAAFDQTTSTFLILYSGGGSRVQQLGIAGDVDIPVAGDFDGDGKTDLAVFDQTTSTFFVLESGGATFARQFGITTDLNVPVAGDFDGDGKTDVAVFDKTTATFLIEYSGGGSRIKQLGNFNDVNIPEAVDLDGDGKTDLVIFDQTAAKYYAIESGGATLADQFGYPGDVNVPVFGDFDGDGKADIAIFDTGLAEFVIQYSGGGSLVHQLGILKHANIPA